MTSATSTVLAIASSRGPAFRPYTGILHEKRGGCRPDGRATVAHASPWPGALCFPYHLSSRTDVSASVRDPRGNPRCGSRLAHRPSTSSGRCLAGMTTRALAPIAFRRLKRVADVGDAVQIHLPNQKILAAGLHDRIFHPQFLGVAGDRIPAHIGVRDIGGFVQFEEIE